MTEYELYLNLGLTHTEAKIYDLLTKYEELDAKSITKKLDLHKKVIYDNLDKLENKSIISSIIKNKRAIYSITDPELLKSLITQKENTLNQIKTETDLLVNNLKKITKQNHKEQKIQTYQGISGIKHVLNTIIKEKQNYDSFGGPIESENIIPEDWWLNFHLKTKENNIYARLIFNKSLKHWAPKTKNMNLEIKFFENIDPLTETLIFADTTAIIVWSQPPIATIIKNKDVAKSYKDFFEILWTKAKS